MRVENTSQLELITYRQLAELEAPRNVQPTQEQEARRDRLKRFNRLVIYLPLGLVALAWIVLVGVLFWLAIAGEWFAMDTDQARFRQLLSAIADIVTILALAPLLLLCAVPSVGAIGLYVYRRQRKADAPQAPSLPLFWRIENVVRTIRDRTAATLPKIARPVINAHATGAFIQRLIIEVKQIIRQEIFRNGDDR